MRYNRHVNALKKNLLKSKNLTTDSCVFPLFVSLTGNAAFFLSSSFSSSSSSSPGCDDCVPGPEEQKEKGKLYTCVKNEVPFFGFFFFFFRTFYRRDVWYQGIWSQLDWFFCNRCYLREREREREKIKRSETSRKKTAGRSFKAL